jgi:hypothetical protein
MAATVANSLTLVSTGLADTRLQPPKGRPELDQFVKVVHKTTRYAAQWNRVEFDGSVEFGQRVSVTIPRIGELVSGFTIAVTMPDLYTPQLAAIRAAGGTSLTDLGRFLGPLYGWTNSLGHALIQRVELEIGGAIVETLDGRLLEILDELYETVESAQSKNAMIKRAANGYKATTFLTPSPTVYIPIPFWFARPGVYGHALPIDALSADLVRVHVTLRPVAQLYFTEARTNPTLPLSLSPAGLSGTMTTLAGAQWLQRDPAGTPVKYLSAAQANNAIPASVLPGLSLPLRFSPSAYALIEYISLDLKEALGFRDAELTYQVEQHQAVESQPTLGLQQLRVEVPYANPVKEVLWVFQRPEAEAYNAWFLFTQDLGPLTTPGQPQQPTLDTALPWWPDAVLNPTPALTWRVRPAFQQSNSEPLESATLTYSAFERFVHDGGSFFRSVVPAMYYSKAAIHNRYVYAYSFGKKMGRLQYGASGAANWDKIRYKELYLTLKRNRTGSATPSLNTYVYVTNWNVFKVFAGRGGMLFTS